MRRLSAAGLVFLTLLACHRKPSVAPDVIARVGERLLTVTDYKRYLERNAGSDLAQVSPEVSSALLDQYIEELLLSEYAAARGVEVPAEKIAGAVRNDAGSTVIEKRDEMRRIKLLQELSAEVTPAGDDEVRQYYEQHPAEFKSGEEVRVRQILVKDEDLAVSIEGKLKSGADFGELSSQYSLAANAKKGGDIGYVSRGELPKLFEDEIFALKPGAVTDPIRTDSGFQIFKVDDRRPPGMIDEPTAAPVIRERLRDDQLRRRTAELVSKARAEFPVTILTKRLPFRYSGTLTRSENE